MNRDIQIRYLDGMRFVKRYVPINGNGHRPDSADGPVTLRQNGVYWITGMGGLGTIFARHLIEQYDATVVFSGRSGMDLERETRLKGLSQHDRICRYLQGDISQENIAQQHYETIKKELPRIHGIIHTAGVTNDGLLIHKTHQQIEKVLSPKVKGTIALDIATKDEALDFFICFSSIAAVVGNIGQSDYAFANGFMDGFVSWRNGLVAAGQRSGRSVSINWPLWKDGGLRIGDRELQDLERTSGSATGNLRRNKCVSPCSRSH